MLKIHPLMKSSYLKICLLVYLSSTTMTSLFSQSSELILYKDFFYFNSKPFLQSSAYEVKSIDNYGWSMAYKKIKNESRYNQLEAKVFFSKSDDASAPFDRKEILLNFRRGKYLKKQLFNVLKVRYGPSLNVNLVTEELEIGTDRAFRRENISGGIGLSVFGGIEYSLSNRLNIHIDTNLLGMSFSTKYSNIENPVLTERQQRQGGFDFELFGERILKIGIGYNIGTTE